MTDSSDIDTDKNIKAEFIEALLRSLREENFVRLVLGKHRGESDLERVQAVRLQLNQGERLSCTFRYTRRDEVKNFEFEEGAAEIAALLGTEFLSATICTTGREIVLEYSKRRVPRIYTRKASSAAVVVGGGHNREKKRIVDATQPFFRHLGITDTRGVVRAEKYDKFRQVDKFIEIVDGLLRGSALASKRQIAVIDYGSGKNYLTFALYDYLRRTLGIEARVLGVELRPELVASGNETARLCGFAGLGFVEGRAGETAGECDLMVALHACDTATDEALCQAVRAEAAVVIVAPCCHKYVRQRICVPAELRPIFKHGILEEHLAVSLTDGLRALVLQYLGYEAKVFEFISNEHTSKNLMISAVRGGKAQDEKVLAEILKIKETFGLSDFCLDRLLGLRFAQP